MRLLLIFIGITFIMMPVKMYGIRILYNIDDSMPRGFYLATPTNAALAAGMIACVNIPEAAVNQYADRPWIAAASMVTLKRIAAVPGDAVCIKNNQVYINQTYRGKVAKMDSDGKLLYAYDYCGKVPRGYYFVANFDYDKSFDSRYYGLVSQVKRIAKPLWID